MVTMTNRKRLYFLSLLVIAILFLRSFPRLDLPTWSFLLMSREESTFLRTWCRLQRTQLDVGDHLGPCQSCVYPNTPTTSCTPSEAADIQHSYVYRKAIQPAGDFSRLFIKTRNTSGHLKSHGGDSWKVYLHGPSFLSAAVFDYRNGTYEVLFLPVLPGKYRAEIMLVDSVCYGVLSPRQVYNDLGHLEYDVIIPTRKEDPVLHRLQYHMKFRDRLGPSIFNYQRCCGFCASCNFLWNGYGTWEKEKGTLKWRPYIRIDDRPRKIDYREHGPIRKNGTLWFFGDRQSHIHKTVLNRPLCQKIFSNCETPESIYPKEDFHSLKVDHIIAIILSSLQTLFKYVLEYPENALILNGGFLAHLPYNSYATVIDNIAQLLRESFNRTAQAQIIWSTMTSSPGSRHTNLHYPVYNAYANWKMCNAKIPILDLFQLSDSFPHSRSKGKLKSKPPYESVERLLEEFFERTADR